MLRYLKRRIPAIAAIVLLAAPRAASACSVCMGRADDPATRGLNAAVVTLVVALLFVMGPIIGFIGYLARRAVTHPLAMPNLRGGIEYDGLDS